MGERIGVHHVTNVHTSQVILGRHAQADINARSLLKAEPRISLYTFLELLCTREFRFSLQQVRVPSEWRNEAGASISVAHINSGCRV